MSALAKHGVSVHGQPSDEEFLHLSYESRAALLAAIQEKGWTAFDT